MSFGINNDNYSRLVNKRTKTDQVQTVSGEQLASESKEIKKAGGMFSRFLSTLRVKFFGKGVSASSVPKSKIVEKKRPNISKAVVKEGVTQDHYELPKNDVQLITHKKNVIGIKVAGKLMSLKEANALPNKSPELKTTLAALLRGGNERLKGSQEKIGSKLYVNGDQVSVRTSIFGDRRKTVAGKVSIDLISDRLKTGLQYGNYSREFKLPKKMILHDLSAIKELDVLTKDSDYDKQISRLVQDISAGLSSLPEDLNDSTFAHFNNVSEKFELLKDIFSTVDSSPSLKAHIMELQTLVDDKKELFEKIKTYNLLNSQLDTLTEKHVDSKAASFIAPSRAEVSSVKNWDEKIESLQQIKSQVTKGIDLELQLASIKSKAASFGDEVSSKVTEFDATLASQSTLADYTSSLSTGLTPLTKEIARAAVVDSKSHISTMKTSVTKLHASYQEGVNFGFKKMLFSFKSRFEKRFDYLNQNALSADNVEREQQSQGVSDPVGLTKDAKTELLDNLKGLYLEKRFGAVYKTHAGTQYTTWKTQVRDEREINQDIHDMLKDAGYADPTKMKGVVDSIFEDALTSISSTFKSDAGQFIVSSFAKDAYYSTLRAQGEMVTALETGIADFESILADTSATSVVETRPDRLIDDLVDFNAYSAKFQEFSTAYLVGKQADHLITKEGLSLIVEDYLSKHSSIPTPSLELKQKFVDYAFSRLARKGFVTESGQFNLDKTLEDVDAFVFRVNTHNLKGKASHAVGTREDRDIYKEHFAQESISEKGREGKTFFKAMVPDSSTDGFDSFLKSKLRVTVTDRGQYAEQRRMLATLVAQKSSAEEFVVGAKLKTEVWGVQFKQAKPLEKLKMLYNVKKELEETYEDVTEEGSMLESKAEGVTEGLDSAAEALAGVSGKLDELESQVDSITGNMSQATQKLELLTRALGKMESGDSSATSAVEDLSLGLDSVLSDVRHTAGQVVDTVSPFLGEAKDAIEAGVDAVLSNVPFYNQVEGAAIALAHLAKAGYSSRQLKQFAEITNKVSSINSFGTATDLENGPEELKESVTAFADYMKTQGTVSKELLKAAFSLANAISPPGVKLGVLTEKIHSVFSFDELSDEAFEEISKSVSTINDEFASVGVDEPDREKDMEAKAQFFMHRLEHADLDQIADKVVGDMPVITFYKVAQAYQELAFSGASAATMSSLLLNRYTSLS